MPVLTFSAQLDTNVPIAELDAADNSIKASAYFEDYLFKLFQDIENINVVAGLAYGVINGDSGQANAVVATDTISILGGTSITTAAAEGAPDTLTITNDDPFPEAPIDGQPYGRRDAGWIDLDTLFIPDAPIDGQTYARLNGAWTDITSGLNQDHGLLTGLADDDHLQYLLLAGRAGGQSAFGGTAAGEILDLTGAASGGADLGIVRINSPITSTYDTFANTTPVQQFMMRWAPTVSITGSYIGGALQTAAIFNISTAVFIPAIFSDTNRYNIGAAPGFSAITFINELSVVANDGNFALPSALVTNVGLTHERNTSGTSTTAGTTGTNFAPQTRTTVVGAIMTKTSQVGLRMGPTFSTVGFSTVNLGTIVGLDCFQPAVALFQPAAGVENMTAYYGIRFPNMTFGGANRVINVINSALAAATNVRVINATGTAQSDFGGTINLTADLVGIQYGATTDFITSWGAAAEHFWQWNASADQLRWSNPSANRYILQTENGNADGEFNVGMERFSFGQTGAVGNQAGVFVQNARTITVAGGYASFLLTVAANLNLGVLAMSDVSAWVVNALSFDNTAYSISELATFKVGGMTTSNPGGTVTERAGLWATGRFLQRGTVQYVPITPAALATGNNNDWAGLLTGSPSNNTRRWARIEGDGLGTSILTGIDATAVQDGDTFDLTNIGTDTITITNQDVASAAANRIDLGSWSGTLTADDSVTVRYDSTSTFWRVIGSQIA